MYIKLKLVFSNLVESIGSVNKVDKSCETPPTFILHGKILDVENMHMQVIATHFSITRIRFVGTIDSIDVEVMQFMVIQIHVLAWKPIVGA
jgi:hypothetical protein